MKTNQSFSKERVFNDIRVIQKFLLLFISCFILNGLSAQNNETVKVGSIEAKQGEKVSGSLIIEKGIDKETFIPITIINGSKPGPVLTLIGGIHGTEYVPIITLQKIIDKINSKELSGTVIIVHVANIPSFSKRTVYFSPGDDKNLNRVFPGKVDGTISERIAFTITQEIINQSDYLIDMHGGEHNEEYLHYAYYYHNCPDIEVCKKSNLLAEAFGFKYLFIEDYYFVPDSLQPMYCELTGLRMSVPTTGVEFGERGIVNSETVNFAVQGILNVLNTLEMTNGEVFKYDSPIFLDDDVEIDCNYDGIFYTLAHAGQIVKKGELIGHTTDFFGNKVEEYYSPITGIIIMNYNTPPVSKGESIFWIAKIVNK